MGFFFHLNVVAFIGVCEIISFRECKPSGKAEHLHRSKVSAGVTVHD